MDKEKVARELIKVAKELIGTDDKTKRTKAELKRGLANFVQSYNDAKKYGNKALQAELKKTVDGIIQRQGLDADMVWKS